MKKFITLVVMLMVSSSLFAATETGYVQFEHGQYNSSQTSAGYTFFYLSGPKSGAPVCAMAYGGGERWVINNDWPAAKIQMSILLAAAIANRQVTVMGSNDCGVISNSETASNILISP